MFALSHLQRNTYIFIYMIMGNIFQEKYFVVLPKTCLNT